MFKDAQEELERLQDALLNDDEDDMQYDEDDTQYDEDDENLILEAYNTDNSDVDLDELSENLLHPQPKSLTGVATFIVVLTLVIVGLVAWWALRQMGVL